MKKIILLLFIFGFLAGCQATKDALTLKKKNNADEFLVEKKNPLVLPPDFDKLPKPGEASIKSTKDIKSDQSNIENLLKKSKIEDDTSSSEQSTSIESSILKKIK